MASTDGIEWNATSKSWSSRHPMSSVSHAHERRGEQRAETRERHLTE